MTIKNRLMRAAALATIALAVIAPSKAFCANLGEVLFWGIVPALTGLTPRVWNDTPIMAIGTYTPGVEVIYLNVPNDHRRNWKKHCHRYDACHRPVYFLQGNWYRQVYVPRYRQAPAKPHAHWAAPHMRHPSVTARPAPRKVAPPPRVTKKPAPAPRHQKGRPAKR